MSKQARSIADILSKNWVTGLICLLPFLVLEGLQRVNGASFDPPGMLSRLFFTASVLGIAWSGITLQDIRGKWNLSKIGVGFLTVGLCAWIVYAIWQTTWAAWIGLSIYYASVLGLARWLLADLKKPWRNWLQGCFIFILGLLPSILGQVESRFSEEEFFILLQGLSLGVYALVLWWVTERLLRNSRKLLPEAILFTSPQRRFVSLGLGLIAVLGLWGTMRAYQHSFFPAEAPGFPGIDPEHPFICGEIKPVTTEISGLDVQSRIVEQIRANPDKSSSDYAFLALVTGDQSWMEAYRAAILSEARQSNFTARANSVKYVQYQAAMRLYFYDLVRGQFPHLFSENEQQELAQWFAEINQRAMTVEWVDWLYALAFAKRPEGLYENQETGAGLLALLESSNLADPDLVAKNNAYLEQQKRGWQRAFRVTDDAYIYQTEWIYNALFQSQRTGIDLENATLSFEWLLYQALPDGSWPGYNHAFEGSLTGVSYLGANLLQDGQMLWLADQAINASIAQGISLNAQPGMEQTSALYAKSPTVGSCLIYGNSGLPNQAGPLAADKLVFRDGWEKESRTLLVNLRFTGWHRYKATGSVVLYHEAETLIEELTIGQSYAWLPVGRSLFRDKRIPRENLNGLLVSRDGLGKVLYDLTGSGGSWAQDPPYYALVEQFSTSDAMDSAFISMQDWHGWDSWREVILYHSGPLIILDQVLGPTNGEAAVPWHVLTSNRLENGRVMLLTGENPVEMLVIPVGSWAETDSVWQQNSLQGTNSTIWAQSEKGELCLASIILSGAWVGAEAQTVPSDAGSLLELRAGNMVITQPLSFDCSNEDGS